MNERKADELLAALNGLIARHNDLVEGYNKMVAAVCAIADLVKIDKDEFTRLQAKWLAEIDQKAAAKFCPDVRFPDREVGDGRS